MKTPYDVLLRPVVTERSMDDTADKKYTFIVDKRANKTEIKAAVEEAFGVQVVSVNTANFQGKLKRQGRFEGYTAAYKKAIVKLSESSKSIEFFEGL
ncbi:MAG: 50S ribosomal protein L23 [Firmicutes bacterium]|jgi:large subunit ribosomal protein L23|nr:50S ribosomal protein L23 [Bacillota bacterium]